ncbi:MAG: ABC transporter permease [Bradymonadaceae bacterium]|nr:ABC transporter permease [Lujinxingiaceae bacterium]
MSPNKLTRLVVQSIARNMRGFLFSSIGIVVGIATLLFFTSLGSGIKHVVLERIFVVRLLEVEKKSYDLGGGMRSGGLFGSKSLDDRTVEELKQLAGVKDVYPKMKFTFPASARGGKRLLGQDMTAELIADGIPSELVRDEVRSDLGFEDWGAELSCAAETPCPDGFSCEAAICQPKACTGADSTTCTGFSYCHATRNACALPIPVLINPTLLEVYNSSVHTALGGSRGAMSRMPRLSEDMLVGFEFDAVFGESFLGRAAQGESTRERMRLVGFSDKAMNLGVTVPIGYVKRLNARFSGERAAEEYHSIVVETSSNDAIAHVAYAVTEQMGLSLSERHGQAQRAGLLIMLITMVFNLIALIILAISAINIMHTFLMMIIERRRELGLMRALGATRSHVRWLVLGEASVLGLFGGSTGALLGYLTTRAVDAVFNHYVAQFPFKPDSLFLLEAWMLLASIGVALLFCWIGALLPAFRASRVEPASAISGR